MHEGDNSAWLAAVEAFIARMQARPPAPPRIEEPVTYRLAGGWVFQPRLPGASDGWAFDPRKPKKRRHDAFGLGGVVICSAWKKPRRVLGLWPTPRP